jgi:uncharacterized delta-60 repeat protein
VTILRARSTLPILTLVAALVSGTNAAANAVLNPGSGLAAPVHAKAGDLDRSFGIGGKVTTDFAGDQDAASALVVQGTKLVAAGNGAAVPGGLSAFALARYNADGSLDTSFGTAGKVTTEFPGGGDANALVVQADGKLLAAGMTGVTGMGGRDFALARYQGPGKVDHGVWSSVIVRCGSRAWCRLAAAMLSWPLSRSRLIARLRRVAMTRGAFPVLTRDLSSW